MYNLINLMGPALLPLALMVISLIVGLTVLVTRKTLPEQRDLQEQHKPRRKQPGTFSFELNGASLVGICIILAVMFVVSAGAALLDLIENEPVSVTAEVDKDWYENGRSGELFPVWRLTILTEDEVLTLRAAPQYVDTFPVEVGGTYVFRYYPRTRALYAVEAPRQ